jgi:hypothetical protein
VKKISKPMWIYGSNGLVEVNVLKVVDDLGDELSGDVYREIILSIFSVVLP